RVAGAVPPAAPSPERSAPRPYRPGGTPGGAGPGPGRGRPGPRGGGAGPGAQGFGLVVLAILVRQHEDRGPVALGPQRPADLVAVHPGEQDVEDDRAVAALARPPQAVGAGGADVE